MLANQRRSEIEKMLIEKKDISVVDTAEHFGVSTETIRRDFDYLSKKGVLERSHGGATLSKRVMGFVGQQVKSSIYVENKKKMMECAYEFIRPNDCIFLDHTTTVYEICPYIENIPLTIVTNSLYIMNFFSRKPNIRLVAPGGNFNSDIQGFFGLQTLDFLEKHTFDKAFISPRSVNMNSGIGDNDEQISAIHRVVLNQASQRFIIADHTKIGYISFIGVTDFSDVDILITDYPLPREWKTFLENENTKFIEAFNHCKPE